MQLSLRTPTHSRNWHLKGSDIEMASGIQKLRLGMETTSNKRIEPSGATHYDMTAQIVSSVQYERSIGRVDLPFSEWFGARLRLDLKIPQSTQAKIKTVQAQSGAIPIYLEYSTDTPRIANTQIYKPTYSGSTKSNWVQFWGFITSLDYIAEEEFFRLLAVDPFTYLADSYSSGHLFSSIQNWNFSSNHHDIFQVSEIPYYGQMFKTGTLTEGSVHNILSAYHNRILATRQNLKQFVSLYRALNGDAYYYAKVGGVSLHSVGTSTYVKGVGSTKRPLWILDGDSGDLSTPKIKIPIQQAGMSYELARPPFSWNLRLSLGGTKPVTVSNYETDKIGVITVPNSFVALDPAAGGQGNNNAPWLKTQVALEEGILSWPASPSTLYASYGRSNLTNRALVAPGLTDPLKVVKDGFQYRNLKFIQEQGQWGSIALELEYRYTHSAYQWDRVYMRNPMIAGSYEVVDWASPYVVDLSSGSYSKKQLIGSTENIGFATYRGGIKNLIWFKEEIKSNIEKLGWGDDYSTLEFFFEDDQFHEFCMIELMDQFSLDEVAAMLPANFENLKSNQRVVAMKYEFGVDGIDRGSIKLRNF